MTVCFRVYTNESSSAAQLKAGFPVNAAWPMTKLHAAVDNADRRVNGDESNSWGRSVAVEPEESGEGDSGTTAFCCSDREYTSPRKFPDDTSAIKARATPACDIFLTLFMVVKFSSFLLYHFDSLRLLWQTRMPKLCIFETTSKEWIHHRLPKHHYFVVVLFQVMSWNTYRVWVPIYSWIDFSFWFWKSLNSSPSLSPGGPWVIVRLMESKGYWHQ